MYIAEAIKNTGLETMIAAASATILAQSLKIIWYFLTHQRINFKIFFHTGGMPSSHSATVSALAFSVGLINGFTSTIFAVATGLAVVVMYDAAGVRRAAGKMAGILNKITEDFYHHHSEELPEKLMELLGHTPFEVVVGSAFGVLIAYLIHI